MGTRIPAGLRELNIFSGLTHQKPTAFGCQLHAGDVLSRAAPPKHKLPDNLADIDVPALIFDELAISRIRRAAFSGARSRGRSGGSFIETHPQLQFLSVSSLGI